MGLVPIVRLIVRITLTQFRSWVVSLKVISRRDYVSLKVTTRRDDFSLKVIINVRLVFRIREGVIHTCIQFSHLRKDTARPYDKAAIHLIHKLPYDIRVHQLSIP